MNLEETHRLRRRRFEISWQPLFSKPSAYPLCWHPASDVIRHDAHRVTYLPPRDILLCSANILYVFSFTADFHLDKTIFTGGTPSVSATRVVGWPCLVVFIDIEMRLCRILALGVSWRCQTHHGCVVLNLVVGSEIREVQPKPVSTFKHATSGQSHCEWGRYPIDFHNCILELPERNVLSISWSEKDNGHPLGGSTTTHRYPWLAKLFRPGQGERLAFSSGLINGWSASAVAWGSVERARC
jgi:hypothetical protein